MRDVVIIPTYNERENISQLVPEIFKFVPEAEVLVVDDNSPDGTGDAVKEMMGRYPHLRLLSRPKKEGLCPAYIQAFRQILSEGNTRTITMMDADFSHDPKYLPEMFKKSEEYGVVAGSRYIKGGGTEGWELRRRLLSRAGNFYCRVITGLPVRDCTGGFNCMRAEVLRRVDFERILQFRGYAFIMALKYYLWKAGAKFLEIPILFKNRTRGKSKISSRIVREGLLTPWRLVFGGSAEGLGKYFYPLVILTALAFVARLGALFFAVPYENVFGDEIAHVMAAFSFFEQKTIVANFPFYYLPPLMAYLTAPLLALWGIVGIIIGKFNGIAGFREFVILNLNYFLAAPRLVSAMFGALTVPLVFVLARRIFSAPVAFLASIFLAIDFVHIHESAIGHIWAPIVFFFVAASYAAYRLYETGERKWYVFGAVAVGFGYGMGQIPLLFFPWLLLAHFMAIPNRGISFWEKIKDKKFLLCAALVILSVAAFTFLNPVSLAKHINDFLHAINVFFGTNFGKVLNTEFALPSDSSEFSLRRNLTVAFNVLLNTNPILFILGIAGALIYVFSRAAAAFNKILFVGFPSVYFAAVSIIFYRLIFRYALPVEPFLFIMAAYLLDIAFRRGRALRVGAVILILMSVAYSAYYSGSYFVKLQRGSSMGDGVRWVYKNVPSGARIISDKYFTSSKEGILFLQKYKTADWIDARRRLLLTLSDEKYPEPNYFFIDTNLIDVATLPLKERRADYIFLSYYYENEMNEKRGVLKYFPEAKLVKAFYPKGVAGPVKNLLNLDPDFVSELPRVEFLGPNVEIYRISDK